MITSPWMDSCSDLWLTGSLRSKMTVELFNGVCFFQTVKKTSKADFHAFFSVCDFCLLLLFWGFFVFVFSWCFVFYGEREKNVSLSKQKQHNKQKKAASLSNEPNLSPEKSSNICRWPKKKCFDFDSFRNTCSPAGLALDTPL